MAEDIDLESTLQEYGYNRKKKSKHLVGYLLLSILLVASLGGTAFIGKLWTNEKSKFLNSG